MDFNECLSQIQNFLQNSPLIVLGSGASIPYGLPSMSDLAEEIKKYRNEISDKNFSSFCELLLSKGLESALDQADLLQETHNKIRQIVWYYVNGKDLEFWRNYCPERKFAISALINKVIQAAPNKATVVTTNYDRLAEYAADHIQATTITGFEGSLIRTMDFPSIKTFRRRVRTRERQVEIWKVHGSLDWFSRNEENILSFPFSRDIPNQHIPLIIPPGKDKYRNAYKEPFRSVISKADEAFSQAGAFLCIGYGFNDEHIQPKLIAEIEKGRPVVVLARNMSDSCKRLIVESNANRFIILESASFGKTRVHGKGWSREYDGEYWQLKKFMKVW